MLFHEFLLRRRFTGAPNDLIVDDDGVTALIGQYGMNAFEMTFHAAEVGTDDGGIESGKTVRLALYASCNLLSQQIYLLVVTHQERIPIGLVDSLGMRSNHRALDRTDAIVTCDEIQEGEFESRVSGVVVLRGIWRRSDRDMNLLVSVAKED